MRLTEDAREQGELEALHGMEAMVKDLMQTIRSLIEEIESRRRRVE